MKNASFNISCEVFMSQHIVSYIVFYLAYFSSFCLYLKDTICVDLDPRTLYRITQFRDTFYSLTVTFVLDCFLV